MATSAEHYDNALLLLQRAEKLASAHGARFDGARFMPPDVSAHCAAYFHGAQVHAMLAQVTLAYEDRAGYTREDTWAGPDGTVYTEAEALAAGAVWGDYQYEDGTVDENVLILDGEPMSWDERSAPANDYARALAAKL